MKYIPYLKSINKIKKDIIKLVKEQKYNDERAGKMNMNFIKGLLIGGLITSGMMMWWSDDSMDTNKMTKKGKKIAKKMGIM